MADYITLCHFCPQINTLGVVRSLQEDLGEDLGSLAHIISIMTRQGGNNVNGTI